MTHRVWCERAGVRQGPRRVICTEKIFDRDKSERIWNGRANGSLCEGTEWPKRAKEEHHRWERKNRDGKRGWRRAASRTARLWATRGEHVTLSAANALPAGCPACRSVSICMCARSGLVRAVGPERLCWLVGLPILMAPVWCLHRGRECQTLPLGCGGVYLSLCWCAVVVVSLFGCGRCRPHACSFIDSARV